MTLPRLKPDPIPAIHPLPEYLATGQRKAWYEDMKQVLQVPWMGVVTMAFSHYPHFYETLWNGTRDLCRSEPFVEACQGNRAFVEAEIEALNPSSITDSLYGLGYAPNEIDTIRRMIDVFGHGNQPYLILATLARTLLEGGEMTGRTDAAPIFTGRHAPDHAVPLVLMEAHHADEPTRAVYEDVKSVLGLPFVNTDYRALGRWPSYWSKAWTGLREAVNTSAHEALCDKVHQRCLELANILPNPARLSAEALRSAAERDGDQEEIRDMCRLFQWLLPGLVVNVAFLRAQLEPDV